MNFISYPAEDTRSESSTRREGKLEASAPAGSHEQATSGSEARENELKSARSVTHCTFVGVREPLLGPSLTDYEAEAAEERDNSYSLPVSHEAHLEGHSKAVSCLDLDHTGSRLLSGSRDSSVQLFDFNGMNSTLKCFRRINPSEGYPMVATSWSPTGNAFLAVSGSAQINIYSRDGILLGESARGDMYIRDQQNTKGHICPATGGEWHPSDKCTAMTCSEDGTLRLWDTEQVTQKTVFKPSLPKACRVGVSACAYSPMGSSIAAGLVNGSIHIWDAKGSTGRSAAIKAVPVPRAQMVGKQDWRFVLGGAQSIAREAHPGDTNITSLAFSKDNHMLLSRAADDTLKVWDLRRFKFPLQVHRGLPNIMSTTGVCFSPDDRLAITGTSSLRDGSGAALVFIDVDQNAVVKQIQMPSNVIAVSWHERLNQIFVGTGNRASGAVRVLYSPSLSERGVLLCAHRKPRVEYRFDVEAPLVVHNPHALPLFREERGSKRHLDGRPKNAADKFKPDIGSSTLEGTGSGGRIGTTGGTLLTQHVLKKQGKLNDPQQEDIRSKILRHGDAKGETVKLFSKVYEETQPSRIYAKHQDKDEEKPVN